MAKHCTGGLRSMRSSSLDTFCASVEGLAIPAQTREEEVLIFSEQRVVLRHPKGGKCKRT